MNILETRNLEHEFNGYSVLKKVNLEIKKGETHAIIGPNGAGKTTLFNVISGMYAPSKGKVIFKKKDITGFKAYKIQRLGMGRSFQITATFDNLSAFQNIRMAILSRKGIRFNLFRFIDKMDKVTTETITVLQNLDLWETCHTPAGMLSYGKQRSLEIGMALATDPDLVMLDEPAAGMSADETHTAVGLIKKLTKEKTVVIIEHDMDVVFSLADRITVLNHGTILATGTPEEIKANKDVQAAYLGRLEDE